MLLSSASTSLFLVGWRLPEPNAFNLTSSEVPVRILCTVSHLCPTPQHLVFGPEANSAFRKAFEQQSIHHPVYEPLRISLPVTPVNKRRWVYRTRLCRVSGCKCSYLDGGASA